MAKLECVGGPCDGLMIPDAPATWRWIHPVHGRGYKAERSGTVLYIRKRRRWVFAGHTASVCVGCGGLVDSTEATPVLIGCPLCGAKVTID